MERKRTQGNTTPKNANNNIIKDLVKSESPVANFKRSFKKVNEYEEELKENMQKQFNNYQEKMD
jgi:hypothetical protein